jgi:hypothetical protein
MFLFSFLRTLFMSATYNILINHPLRSPYGGRFFILTPPKFLFSLSHALIIINNKLITLIYYGAYYV